MDHCYGIYSIHKETVKPLSWKGRKIMCTCLHKDVFVYLLKNIDSMMIHSHVTMTCVKGILLLNQTFTLCHWWKATRSLYKVSSFSINFAWKRVILAQSCLLSQSKCDKCLMKTTPHSLVSDNSYHTALLWFKQTLKRSSKHDLHHRILYPICK